MGLLFGEVIRMWIAMNIFMKCLSMLPGNSCRFLVGFVGCRVEGLVPFVEGKELQFDSSF